LRFTIDSIRGLEDRGVIAGPDSIATLIIEPAPCL
jgi:hypothetical protein